MVRNAIAWLLEFVPFYGVMCIQDGKEVWLLDSRTHAIFIRIFKVKAQVRAERLNRLGSRGIHFEVRRYW